MRQFWHGTHSLKATALNKSIRSDEQRCRSLGVGEYLDTASQDQVGVRPTQNSIQAMMFGAVLG